jgi:hypothetical protein
MKGAVQKEAMQARGGITNNCGAVKLFLEKILNLIPLRLYFK